MLWNLHGSLKKLMTMETMLSIRIVGVQSKGRLTWFHSLSIHYLTTMMRAAPVTLIVITGNITKMVGTTFESSHPNMWVCTQMKCMMWRSWCLTSASTITERTVNAVSDQSSSKQRPAVKSETVRLIFVLALGKLKRQWCHCQPCSLSRHVTVTNPTCGSQN